MRQLYPAVQPYATFKLDVGDGHSLHVERCGTRGAIPLVFLHGGPGGGCKADHRQYFAPELFDVVLFDQRGAGRSTPFGGVEQNDTARSITDMEALREQCGFAHWVVFGGSWGATLALAYAESHPERVMGLILRGTFLARESDLRWFAGNGANRMLPVQWQRFLDVVDARTGSGLISYLYAETFASERARVEAVARAWEAWSGAVVMFSLDQSGDGVAADLDTAIAKLRIEMHYAYHHYFLAENQLLMEAHRLPRVPTTIIHGARDLTCTADAAWAIHQAIAGSRLEILRTAGHLGSETPMIDALVRATDEIASAIAGR